MKLHEYVELINSKWKKTGLTLHEIFSKATRYREQLDIDPDSLKTDGVSGTNLTLVKQKELIDQGDILHRIYDQVSSQVEDGEISRHYWYGVENTELMGFQATSLHKSLEEWTISLQELDKYWSQVNHIFAMDNTIAIDLNTIWHISASISKLPELGGGEPIKEIKTISEQLGSFKEMLENYELIHQRHEELSVHLKESAINEAATSIILCETEKIFKKLGLQEATTLNDISILFSKIEKNREQITALENDFGMIRSSIPSDLQQCFIVTKNGLKEFKSLARLISELPENLWRYRNEIYDNPDLDPLLEQMTKKLTVLTPLHKKIQEHVILDRLPEIEELKKWQFNFDNAGLFKWFSPEWRKTRKELLFLSTVLKPDLSVLIQLLPEIILYLEGIRNIDSLHEKDDVLGEDYDGVDTPIDRILELRNWYKSVRMEYGIGFGGRVAIGNSLIKLDRNIGVSINECASRNLKELTDKITLDMTDFISVFTRIEKFNNPNFYLANIYKDLAKEISGGLEPLGNIVENKGLDLTQLKNISLDLSKQQQEIAIWEKMPITKQLTN
ncbi:MAG: hypothetical protein P8M34_01470, partial [Saprospiraceae bacterium]|nr:hypothetical protein [Saprospiraceae bacterium]